MDEERLAAELQRRADSAGSRPDWVRRDLLPAVRHEIDTRPQPVMTSSWSPRLGVAAVVAALLIMVIAVPRLAPQPPAATPSPTASPAPGPETVLSTSEFADGVASGQLIGRVVLVQGKISVPSTPEPADYPCNPPDGLCGLGALEGTDPLIYVDATYTPTTDSPGSGTWAGTDGGRDYHFPTVPIEGVLVLAPVSGPHVAFIGLLKPAAPGTAWTIAGVTALDLATVGPDAAVIVRGHLSSEFPPGTVTDRACPSENLTNLDGLSSRFCFNHDLLSSDGTGGGQMDVQAGAADEFGQDGDALYALSPRLYGGGCVGTPPCWLWDVVARLNGPPVMPSATAAATIECARGTGMPITITDEAGVVADCRVLDGVSASDQPLVHNPRGNLSRLEVFVTVNRCVSGADATLTAGPGGYDLVITERAAVPGCTGPAIGIGFDIGLRTDIAASTVNATIASPRPSPSTSTGVITCAGGLTEGLSVSLRDHTGKVVSCASELGTEAPDQSVGVSNPGGDATQMQIHMRVSSCDLRALTLEFWEPPLGHALGEQLRPTHELQIARSETSITCVDSATEITSQTISLLLKTQIDATNVNAFVTTGVVGSNTVETHGNTFALTLKAGRDTYAADSPIDVFATRGYLGPEKTTVSSEGMWFGFEQLDGTLEMWPATTAVGAIGCTTEELQQGDSDTRGYSKSGGWSSDDPNAAFYEQYMQDPLLRLPPGVYRLFAGLSFTNGSCGGESVSVDTSIVIRVEPGRVVTPSASPVVGATPAYDPLALWVQFCDKSTNPTEFANGRGLVVDPLPQHHVQDHYAFLITDGTDPLVKAGQLEIDPAVCDAGPVYIGIVH